MPSLPYTLHKVDRLRNNNGKGEYWVVEYDRHGHHLYPNLWIFRLSYKPGQQRPMSKGPSNPTASSSHVVLSKKQRGEAEEEEEQAEETEEEEEEEEENHDYLMMIT